MSNEKLFNEFPPVSTEQWEELINKDLKGADYEKKLVWRTDEGFKVRPYYRAEDLDKVDYLNSLPNEFPYTRGIKNHDNHWEIVQEITEENLVKANEIALESVERGATVVALNTKNVTDYSALATLLAGLDIETVGVQFCHAQNYVELMRFFVEYLHQNKINKENVQGSLDFDPIVYFLKRTKFYRSQEEDMNEMITLIDMASDMPHFKVLNINGLAMHNAGSTIVQEVGYALGIANEYFAYGIEKGMTIEKIACNTQVTLSVGSNYFMEIAKLRAVRLLWSTVVNQYKPACDCAYKLHINTVASSWNKTLYDPYVNMLRSTTEGMAAAIGGADSISLKPFDLVFKEDDEFSRRISRNIQVILKEESYFDKVLDPAAGSYYIENLTDSIAEHAWKLFQHVEEKGGIIELIKLGEVKVEIEKSCQKRDMDIATRKYILLGTNQYPNTGEMMLDKVERRFTYDSIGLRSYRGAAAFEDIRLETERYAKKQARPKIFLMKIGNLAMRQARAGFITNFFGCAGYEMIETAGYKTVEEGVKAAFDAKADLIVLCSSDEEYATLGVEAAKLIKMQNAHIPVVVAGNPVEAVEVLKNAGVDDFIHVKTNVLESLRSYNERLLK
ncbi:MAG: methylmalonyl-CoA mutase family protein [Bacteroidales bacterium]